MWNVAVAPIRRCLFATSTTVWLLELEKPPFGRWCWCLVLPGREGEGLFFSLFADWNDCGCVFCVSVRAAGTAGPLAKKETQR